MNLPVSPARLPSRQRGAVLVLVLVMLLLLTFMGVTAMNTANLQERMVGNLQDAQIAFEMAEVALREGELWLAAPARRNDPPEGVANPSTSEVFAPTALDAGWWRDFDWSDTSVRTVSLDDSLVQAGGSDTSWYVLDEPRYVISEVSLLTLAGASPVSYRIYRVTARGVGGREGSEVILESHFSLKIPST